jgi:hypothetical protein
MGKIFRGITSLSRTLELTIKVQKISIFIKRVINEAVLSKTMSLFIYLFFNENQTIFMPENINSLIY